jgi:hypothetical protein
LAEGKQKDETIIESKLQGLHPMQKEPAQPRKSEKLYQKAHMTLHAEEKLFREVPNHGYCSISIEINENELIAHSDNFAIKTPGKFTEIIENTVQNSNIEANDKEN